MAKPVKTVDTKGGTDKPVTDKVTGDGEPVATVEQPLPEDVLVTNGDQPAGDKVDPKVVKGPVKAATNADETGTTPPAPDSEDEDDPKSASFKGSKYLRNDKAEDLLRKHFKVGQLDAHMQALLQNSSVRLDEKKNMLYLDLKGNGHTVQCSTLPSGIDYIGMSSAHRKSFDAKDAEACVALSRNRGWTTLNVHGNDDQKGMLWLEAQRHQMTVTNFKPDPNSKYAQQWKAEYAALLDKNGAGVTAGAATGAPAANTDGTAKDKEVVAADGKTATTDTPATIVPATNVPATVVPASTAVPVQPVVDPVLAVKDHLAQAFADEVSKVKNPDIKAGLENIAKVLSTHALSEDPIKSVKLQSIMGSGTGTKMYNNLVDYLNKQDPTFKFDHIENPQGPGVTAGTPAPIVKNTPPKLT